MGYKIVELNIMSAKDLKDVNLIGKMDVYVIVSLSGDPKTKQKTPVHQDGGTCPSWNHIMKFTVDEAVAHQGWVLIFQLRHEHSFGADKDLGEVRVPVKELFNGARGHDAQFVTYQVKRSSGKPKGELKFSYKVLDMADSSGMYSGGKKMNPAVVNAYPPQSCSSSSYPPPPTGQPITAAPYPPTAYPPPPGPPPAAGYPQQQQGGYYPPPPAGYPGAPPPQGYPPQYGGYPPQPVGGQGYGYPPQAGYPQMQQPQKPPKKGNKFGMGLGAGLLGGAIGGLVLGEALDDFGDFDC